MSLPEPKNVRYREELSKKPGSTKVRRIPQIFVVPGPNADKHPLGPDKFRVKGGPGLGPIPKEGRWYDISTYLLKAIKCGDVAEGVPLDEPKETTKRAPTRKAEAKE